MERPAILVWCNFFHIMCNVEGEETRSIMWFIQVQGCLYGSFNCTVYDLMMAGF